MSGTDNRAQREARGERAMVRKIAELRPDLNDRGIDVILAEVRETLAWKSAMSGAEALSTADVLDELRRSGGVAVSILAPQDAPAHTVDHARAIAGLNPGERITYARRHGIG